MIEKLHAHVHSIFAPYKNAKTTKELEEELLQNLLEKYNDHKRNGSSEQELIS